MCEERPDLDSSWPGQRAREAQWMRTWRRAAAALAPTDPPPLPWAAALGGTAHAGPKLAKGPGHREVFPSLSFGQTPLQLRGAALCIPAYFNGARKKNFPADWTLMESWPGMLSARSAPRRGKVTGNRELGRRRVRWRSKKKPTTRKQEAFPSWDPVTNVEGRQVPNFA